MRCPNCDTNNGKTNKYCRACGTRLEVLSSREPEPPAPTDEVALGEELFAVHELVESGDLDTALEKSEALSEANPGSGSAHAIAALVYERKSELAFEDGDPAQGREFLKRAIDRYEAIVDLNPDSAADRGKLASLRMKLSGHITAAPKAPPLAKIVAVLERIPRPALISGAAFVLLLVAVIAITSPSRGGRHNVRSSRTTEVDKPIVTVTGTPEPSADLKVYTFPQAATGSSAPASVPAPAPSPIAEAPKTPAPTAPPPFVEVRPMKVPKIDQTLTLVPAPKTPTKKPATEPAKQPDKPTESKQPSASQPTAGGNSLYAQAIRLHDQGKTSEAIGAANQAIVLWKADIDAGRNVDAARRGVANASKSISVWQDSVGQ